MRATTIFAGTVATVLAASPAFGQAEVTEDGAETLREQIISFVDGIRSDSGVDIQFAEEISVEPAGDAYEVSIPEATVETPDGRLVADPAAMTVMPMDNGWYDASWMLPERLTIEEGGQTGFVTIGSQSGQGVFAPEFETFMSIDATLEAIEVVPPPDEQGSMSVGRISLTGDSEEVGENRYSGTYELVMDDMDFVGEPGRERMSVGELRVDWSVTDLDFPAYTEFAQELERLMAEAEEGGGPPANLFEQASNLLANTPQLLDGLRARYQLEEAAFADGQQDVTVEDTGFAIYLEGLRGDASTFGIELTAGEVGVVPAPPEAAFFPSETRVLLALEDLPNDQLLDILAQFLTGAGEMGPDAAMMMAGLQLQQAVMAGGSTVQIQDITLVNDQAELAMQGVIVPDQAAALGITANADLTIAGLPELIAELQNTLGERAQEPVQVLTVLQTMGAQAGEEGGRDVRTYNLEVLPTGQVLLNGADMAPLMNALQ